MIEKKLVIMTMEGASQKEIESLCDGLNSIKPAFSFGFMVLDKKIDIMNKEEIDRLINVLYQFKGPDEPAGYPEVRKCLVCKEEMPSVCGECKEKANMTTR